MQEDYDSGSGLTASKAAKSIELLLPESSSPNQRAKERSESTVCFQEALLFSTFEKNNDAML